MKEPPKRTALAFALGVFLGFSPLIGIHTLLGIVLAHVFRLNKVTVLVGVYLNNPWVVVPYYGFAGWFGLRLTGLPEGTTIPHVSFGEVFSTQFWGQLLSHYDLLYPVILGSSILAVLLSLLAYPLCLHGIRRFAAHKVEQFRAKGERQPSDLSEPRR